MPAADVVANVDNDLSCRCCSSAMMAIAAAAAAAAAVGCGPMSMMTAVAI